jgi:hypothetical protein
MVYIPTPVPPGSTKVALALPPLTVPELTEEPTWVPPCETANVTVPAFTAPAPLLTVAVSVTFWLLGLNVAVALDALVIVPAAFTVKLCEVSLLPAKFPPAL